MAYCSGAPFLDRALVVADLDGADQLFLVDLHQPGVVPQPGTWPAVGMAGSRSETVVFDRVWTAADATVGAPGDYVARPGFWAGSMGVAACWAGGALGVARVGVGAAAGAADPHVLAHLGAAVSTWVAMWTVLAEAADAVDRWAGAAPPRPSDGAPGRAAGVGELHAHVVRDQVEAGCQRMLHHVGRLSGPAPMVSDRAHARRIPDLLVYLRQHHGEADLARLGSLVVPPSASTSS